MRGQTIGGRYELQQPLGAGAMSSVWLALDRELEREVALKLLAPDADRARFEREAHAVAGLGHPNICQLYDYGESEEGPYMVLEYMPGGTLEDRLGTGAPLADAEAMRIAQEGAAGLAHAHENGLVHRDLKPANILFDAEERVKIADFGIARIEGGNELTVAGTVLGTATYISPEQASGQGATPASDVYSFGVILFRMLTGRTPFESDSAIELVRMHQQQPAPAIESLRADAPPTLATLAQSALAKDPSARPRDGAALLATLTGSADAPRAAAATQIVSGPLGDSSETQVIPRLQSMRRPRRSLPLAAAAAIVLALVGLVAAFALTGSGSGGGGTTSIPGLSLPTVGRQTTMLKTAPLTTPATTAPSSMASTTSAPSSSSTRQLTTTAPLPTTRAVTTRPAPVPATTSPLPTPTDAPATTTTAPATTVDTTTAPATTTVP